MELITKTAHKSIFGGPALIYFPNEFKNIYIYTLFLNKIKSNKINSILLESIDLIARKSSLKVLAALQS